MKAGNLGLLSVGLIFGLSACDLINPSGGPAINSFTATPSSITAGQPSVLAWSVDSAATSISISGGVGNVTSDTDDRVTVTPTTTTEYTLTATNADGSSTRDVTVTVAPGDGGSGTPGPVPGPDPITGGPTGTFGVSTSATGPFSNDADGGISSDADERIISVPAGGTFYAEVAYTDSDGVADINVLLVNDEPADLTTDESPTGPFTVGEPTGSCDLGASATSVTCVYPITVAAGTPDIATLPGAGNEFAYVFRVAVTDGAGNAAGQSSRGYVNVTP